VRKGGKWLNKGILCRKITDRRAAARVAGVEMREGTDEGCGERLGVTCARQAALRSGGDPDDLASSAVGSPGADADLVYLEAGVAQPPGEISVRAG
jgi:hypothetical protein